MKRHNDMGNIVYLEDKTIFTIPAEDESETEKSKWLRMKELMATQGINLTGDFPQGPKENEK